MIAARVQRWSAWSPGLEDGEAWRRWCRDPKELLRDGRPDVSFLPALLRRRCSPLARIMLSAAFSCCGDLDPSRVATVFASRHGNINESIDLLERLARKEALSPTRFSHTVHNAQAALFSIAARNRRASSSIAAQSDTFPSGWIEALTLLGRDPQREVLLVVGDVPLAPTFAELVDEPESSYAVALLLARGGGPASLGFALEQGEAEPSQLRWPQAVEFLRWLLSGEPRLSLPSGERRWVWERSQEADPRGSADAQRAAGERSAGSR